jgi:hypothetical protein
MASEGQETVYMHFGTLFAHLQLILGPSAIKKKVKKIGAFYR